jgi:uncharacterized protein (DUF779 family)
MDRRRFQILHEPVAVRILENTQLIIDVAVPGMGGMFSLENGASPRAMTPSVRRDLPAGNPGSLTHDQYRELRAAPSRQPGS